MTENGPALAPALEPGVDRIWIVDRNGAFALSHMTEAEPSTEVLAWRLLTAAGDVVLPSGALALTSAGPLEGDEVDEALRRREEVRLDIVSPEDLPPPKSLRVPVPDVYRSCLAALPRGVIQLPRGDGVADRVLPHVVEIVETAQVPHRSASDDRWVAMVMEPFDVADRAARAEWELQAGVLTMLTAWAAHENDYESRVRFDDSGLRRRLLAAAAGAGQAFTVRWLPGYCPVECRVRIAGARPWPARVIVRAVTPLLANTFRVCTASAGDLIVSLAVLRQK